MFGLTPFNSRRNNDVVRKGDINGFRSIVDEFFNDSFMPTFFTAGTSVRADIRESEKEYVIEAEIPGVRKEDIKLDLRNDVLTISVEHNEQVNEERDNYIRRERRYGSYGRSFHVENVKNEEVKARYRDGILEITLPKQEGGSSRRHSIEIQ